MPAEHSSYSVLVPAGGLPQKVSSQAHDITVNSNWTCSASGGTCSQHNSYKLKWSCSAAGSHLDNTGLCPCHMSEVLIDLRDVNQPCRRPTEYLLRGLSLLRAGILALVMSIFCLRTLRPCQSESEVEVGHVQFQPTAGIHPIGKKAGENITFSTGAPPPGMLSIGIVGLLSAGITDVATKLGLKAEGCNGCGCDGCDSCDSCDGCVGGDGCGCCRDPGPVPAVLSERTASLALQVEHF